MRVYKRVVVAMMAAGLLPCAYAAQPQRTTSKVTRPTQAKARVAARPTPKTKARVAARPAATARSTKRAAPPLSYLRENSYSLNQVIAQIRGNRQLLLRYANHFHIPPEQVIPYFQQNLVESYVPTTRRYKVWMKRPDGSTFWQYQTFRAGERVLALRNGEPVLKWACGNPLSTRLPEIQKRKVVQRTKKVLPNVQKRTRYYTVETPFETPPQPRQLAALPPDYGPPASEMTQLVTRRAIPTYGRWFPAAGLLALIPDRDKPVIPEPSTSMLALSGLLGVGIIARVRRR